MCVSIDGAVTPLQVPFPAWQEEKKIAGSWPILFVA
jgi:hypothetical protein